jgi:short-subunit dehydrogenase
MNIKNEAILITGGGIGRALLEEALNRDAKRVYAGTRQRFVVHSQGAIINVLSLAALASVPFSPAYAISKAAAFSLTQSLRALLSTRGVKIHAVFPGPVDTDMARSLNIPKASPESVAQAILDGVEQEEEDIFPDPMSGNIAEGWRNGVAKNLERQFAAYMPQSMAKTG